MIRDIGKSITLRVDNIIIGLILFLLCALPLAIDLRLVKPFSLCKLILFYGTVLFVITVWSIRIVSIYAKNSTSSRKIPRQSILHFYHTPLTYPVFAYITAVILSTIFSLNRTISIFGYYEHYEGLLTTIGYGIIFFTILTYFKRQHVFYIIFAASIAVFLSSIYGVMQFLYYDPVSWKEWQDVDDRLKIVSTFGNPVFFSGYIVSVFPLILVGFLSQLRSLSSDNTPHPVPLPQGEREHSPVIDNHIDTSALAASSYTVTHGLIDSHIPNPPAAGSHKVTSPPSMGGARGGCKPSPSSTGRKLAAVSLKKPFLEKCFLAFLCIVLMLMLFNLYITKTRGAWLGFVFSILCVMVLLYVEFIVKHRIKFIVSAICFMVIFGVFVGCKYKHPINQLLYLLKQKGDIAVALTDANKGDPIGRSYFINTRGGQSILYRIIQYKSALDIIRDRPLTGIGPDMLSSVLPRYAFNHYKQSPYTPKFENVLGIHNDILDKATTCGIIGLGTYLWIIVTFVTFVKRRFNRLEKHTPGGIGQGNDRLILSGLLACLVGYLVQQQFTVIEYPITLHFWVFLAVSVVLVNSIGEKDTSAKIAKKERIFQKKSTAGTIQRTRPVFLFYLCYLPIVGFLVYSLCYMIYIYKADVMHKKGLDFLTYATKHPEPGDKLDKNPYWEKGLEYYKASISYNPNQTLYRHPLVGAYLFMLKKNPDNVDLIKQTIKECEEIIKIDSNDELAYNYIAQAYDLLEDITKLNYSNKIIPSLEKTITINPYKVTHYIFLCTYYIKKGFYDEANAILDKIYSMPHDNDMFLKKLKVVIYGKRGKWEDVIKESEQILSTKTDDIDAYQNIATAYYMMKKYDDAKRTLEKILLISPGDRSANNLLQAINHLEHKNDTH